MESDEKSAVADMPYAKQVGRLAYFVQPLTMPVLLLMLTFPNAVQQHTTVHDQYIGEIQIEQRTDVSVWLLHRC